LTRAALPAVLASALLAAALLAAAPAFAQPAPAAPAPAVTTIGANLNISPKRVTFDRNRRSATVYIYNQGGAPASFDVALIDRTMLPDGQIVAVSEADQRPEIKPYVDALKSAQPMLLVSPRRVTLAPGQGQTIRMRVNGAPEADTAEYRTHLTVTTIPPRDAGLTAEAAAGIGPNELRFQINSVFGLSIPAIVRTGEPDVRAAIENIRVEYADLSVDGESAPRRTPVAVFDLVRQGANSLFGNVEIRAAGGRNNEPLGIARGVGVYPEIGRRTLRVPLSRAPAAGEKLEVTFTDDDSSPGKLLAKQAS
jgi:P pilus assembly chaperone PapD